MAGNAMQAKCERKAMEEFRRRSFIEAPKL